jgi:hypothetical protein
MRTKTLLLAATALAAGLMTSQAQVYSANIVGYANVATPQGGAFYQIMVPFSIGASNGANEIFGNNLPLGTTVASWSVGLQNYVVNYFDNLGNPGDPQWYMSDDNTVTNPPIYLPGQGLLIQPAGPNVTNVFAGTVAVNVGASNSVPITSGGAFYLVGGLVPYGGVVTNGTASGGGANLNGLPLGSTVSIWKVSIQNYVTYYFDNLGNPGDPQWYMSDDNTITNAPTLNVGQPALIQPAGSGYQWTNGLSSN